MTSQETSVHPTNAMASRAGDWDHRPRIADQHSLMSAAYWVAAVVVVTYALANWWFAILRWQWGWKPLNHQAAIVMVALESSWWLILAWHLRRVRGRGDLDMRLLGLCLTTTTAWMLHSLPEVLWQGPWIIYSVLAVDVVLTLDVGYALNRSPRRTIALFGKLLWLSGLLGATVLLLPLAQLPALAARTVIAYEMVAIALRTAFHTWSRSSGGYRKSGAADRP